MNTITNICNTPPKYQNDHFKISHDILQVEFQYFANSIKSTQPKGWITYQQFIASIKNPKIETQQLFEKIADAAAEGNLMLKDQLKKQLYYFTPAVTLGQKRCYADITGFTGLMVLDWDHLSNAADFKEYIFDEYSCVIACWLSPSRRGVKALVKIPICETYNDYKSYFFGIASEMDVFNGFDLTAQNCVLPLFQSWDADILTRVDASTWKTKGYKLNDFVRTYSEPNHQYTKIDEQRVIKLIDTGFNNIHDNGHPQLRSLCLSIGGYVGNNFISFQDALSYVSHKVENHSYLKKGIAGYKKTAEWAIRVGMTKPLAF